MRERRSIAVLVAVLILALGVLPPLAAGTGATDKGAGSASPTGEPATPPAPSSPCPESSTLPSMLLNDLKRDAKPPAKRKKSVKKKGPVKNAVASGSATFALHGKKVGNAELAQLLATSRNLAGRDLRGMNLTGADLRGVDFRGSILAGANLERADLTEANLERADLTEANLRSASLAAATLRGARLQGAVFDGAIWTDRRICPPGSLGACPEPF